MFNKNYFLVLTLTIFTSCGFFTFNTDVDQPIQINRGESIEIDLPIKNEEYEYTVYEVGVGLSRVKILTIKGTTITGIYQGVTTIKIAYEQKDFDPVRNPAKNYFYKVIVK